MSPVRNFTVKIFADGADLDSILRLHANPLIAGFTTNPTLMRKAGIQDYEAFARRLVDAVRDRPIALEVFADDIPEMIRQGERIQSWGANVNVKIPITDTKGVFTGPAIRALSHSGVRVNVTALFTLDQVKATLDELAPDSEAYISIFAGRIADAGVDPLPTMTEALRLMRARAKTQLIWASPREVFNIVQADAIGCHVITVTHDFIAKLAGIGKDLSQFSLETVRMFRNDAVAAAYSIG